MKLHLGCGTRILDGWVNVDADDHGQQMVADIRALTAIPDDSADEAMAIHVIEHFYPWEVVDVMKEWWRVLKPGGRLVLEFPDWDKVRRFIASGSDNVFLTTFALYGDYRYKSRLQSHHFCWNEPMMTDAMRVAGFVEVHGEPALYHVPTRDLRMVGVKPHAPK